jgi:hypothetical protein
MIASHVFRPIPRHQPRYVPKYERRNVNPPSPLLFVITADSIAADYNDRRILSGSGRVLRFPAAHLKGNEDIR